MSYKSNVNKEYIIVTLKDPKNGVYNLTISYTELSSIVDKTKKDFGDCQVLKIEFTN